jgi:hypothetical protein
MKNQKELEIENQRLRHLLKETHLAHLVDRLPKKKDTKSKKSYWLNETEDGKCPICLQLMSRCHIGSYCRTCSFVDGLAELTEEEAKRVDKYLMDKCV